MKIKLLQNSFNFKNFREFLFIYKDIFIYHEYNFFSKKKTPFIIDCGAHIGIPIIYFKRLYPNAKIIGFEANPTTYSFLKKNITENKLNKIQIYNAALAREKGFIKFYAHKFGWNWGDAGVKNSWYSKKLYNTIRVPSLRLSSYINKPIDLLKIDIEGMEVEVLSEIQNKMHLINEMIIEFHGSKTNKQNNLNKLLNILKVKEFTVTMHEPYTIFSIFNRIFL